MHEVPLEQPRRGGFDAAPATAAQSSQAAQPLLAQLRGLLGIRAFLLVCLACGLGGIAGYGYGIWGPSFLMRSHNLPLAQAGLLFGLASGLGAASGAIFGGWYCDRLTRRDPRWQLRLPMIGAVLGLPMGFAFLLWPTGNWQLGSLAIPPLPDAQDAHDVRHADTLLRSEGRGIEIARGDAGPPFPGFGDQADQREVSALRGGGSTAAVDEAHGPPGAGEAHLAGDGKRGRSAI